MPVNKNMLGRLLVIHGKLSTGRAFTWSQLADACEVSPLVGVRPSKRSLQNDIAFLQQEFGAPIPKGQSAYRYDRPFSFLTILDTDDAFLLNEALALLRQFSQLPQSDGLEEILLKLEIKAGLSTEKVENVVYFEQVPQLKGINFLNELYNYIRLERCVSVDYRDFENRDHQFDIHPYFLKEYNNRWYLYGLDVSSGQIRNLALDRMEGITLSHHKFRPNTYLDPAIWFKDMVGVTRLADETIESVVLRVRKPRAYYVLTKPLHHSQMILREDETQIDFGYRLLLNKELESKILELGADAEVLEPGRLREQVGQLVRALARMYEVNILEQNQ